MSKSELHNWECAIEKLSGDNTDKMLVIAQDIYNTAFIHGKNYMLLEQTRWIPCSERLPDEQERSGWYEGRVSEPVLVTVGDGVTEAFTIDGVWNWYIDTDYYKEIPEKVIAWMPLPEPYKGE